jgi:SPP1 gp7 family putative phage head morphogenesis protein
LIGLVNNDVLQRAVTNDISGLKWTDRLGLHRNTAVMKIRETVTLGLKDGSTYSQMSKRLNDTLSGQVVQPMRIVRTEGHRVFSESKKDTLDVAVKKGVKLNKTWMSSRDERVRSQHSTMDGAIVLYDDNFIMPDGAQGFAPGIIGAPQHDIYCRCDWSIDFID